MSAPVREPDDNESLNDGALHYAPKRARQVEVTSEPAPAYLAMTHILWRRAPRNHVLLVAPFSARNAMPRHSMTHCRRALEPARS